MARELLFKVDEPPGLAGESLQRLRANGIGRAKVPVALAAPEIACRMAAAEVPERQPLPGRRGCRYLDLRYGPIGQEVMGAIYCNAWHCLIGERELLLGTLHRASPEPREVLRAAPEIGGAALLLFHTPPSRDPASSREHVLFTRSQPSWWAWALSD